MTDIYDKLAPIYRQYSKKRSLYLKSIDIFVIQNIKIGGSILDVGAGDGYRGNYIAKKSKSKFLALCDPSKSMFEKCKQLNPNVVQMILAENLDQKLFNNKFDTILCLWNVLGHVKTSKKRIKALKNMKSLLNRGGKIFIDVNNRYNLSNYGIKNVTFNIIKDIIKPDEKNGDVSFTWTNGKIRIPASGHLFTPLEMKDLVKKSHLNTLSSFSVDYSNGKISRSLIKGQLLYVLGEK